MRINKFLKLFGITFAFVSTLSLCNNEFSVHAEESKVLTFDKENKCEFGMYPTKIDTSVDISEIKNNGEYDLSTNVYSYNNEKYMIINAEVDLEHTFTLSNKDDAKDYISQEVAIKFEKLNWYLFDKGKGYVDLICANIIDRMQYYYDGTIPSSYTSSDVFAKMMFSIFSYFSSDEIDSLKTFDENVYVTIPEYNDFINKKLDVDFTPTDYSILKGLSSHLDNPNNHSPFWTQTVSGNRIKVIWNDSNSTNCLTSDNRIGVTPIIRVEYNGSVGVGTTTNSKSPTININFTGTVWMIIIGLVFIVAGGITLIIIMKNWYKELKVNTKLKVKPKTFVGGGITLTILIIGLYIFSFGTVVKVNSLGFNNSKDIHGYYIGNGYDENFEFGSRLMMGLTKDHKVYRYMGNPWNEEGSATNIPYYVQPGIGRWEYKDGLLTIYAASEWTRYNWEMLETTYKDANGVGSFIKYVGYEGSAYQWSHSSNNDPVYDTVKFFEATGGW